MKTFGNRFDTGVWKHVSELARDCVIDPVSNNVWKRVWYSFFVHVKGLR